MCRGVAAEHRDAFSTQPVEKEGARAGGGWYRELTPEEEKVVNRLRKAVVLLGSGVLLLQFDGCIANALADVFFAVGPLLL